MRLPATIPICSVMRKISIVQPDGSFKLIHTRTALPSIMAHTEIGFRGTNGIAQRVPLACGLLTASSPPAGKVFISVPDIAAGITRKSQENISFIRFFTTATDIPYETDDLDITDHMAVYVLPPKTPSGSTTTFHTEPRSTFGKPSNLLCISSSLRLSIST